MDDTNAPPATLLCLACGLCCTGHLFIWAKLRPAELNQAEALGLRVFRSDPTQRGFSQPCPLWQGRCTIHASPQYPHICRAYKCKLLKSVLAENIPLPNAMAAVEQAKELISSLEKFLPASTNPNFRERLVAHIENPAETAKREIDYPEFRQRAGDLLDFYEKVFGVNDLLA